MLLEWRMGVANGMFVAISKAFVVTTSRFALSKGRREVTGCRRNADLGLARTGAAVVLLLSDSTMIEVCEGESASGKGGCNDKDSGANVGRLACVC